MARDVLLLIENHINNMRARAQIKINKGMCEQENLISKAMKKWVGIMNRFKAYS